MIRTGVATTIFGAVAMLAGDAASATTTAEALVRGASIIFGMGFGGSIVVWLVKREVERIDRRIGDHEKRLRVLETAPERRSA